MDWLGGQLGIKKLEEWYKISQVVEGQWLRDIFSLPLPTKMDSLYYGIMEIL